MKPMINFTQICHRAKFLVTGNNLILSIKVNVKKGLYTKPGSSGKYKHDCLPLKHAVTTTKQQ